MKLLIDYIMELLEDFKEKEYIAGRDMVNHPDNYDYHKGQQTLLLVLIKLLQSKLDTLHSSTYDAILKQIAELTEMIIPMAKKALAIEMRKEIHTIEFIDTIDLYRHDHIEFEWISKDIPRDSFESLANFLVDQMEGTSVKLSMKFHDDNNEDFYYEVELSPDYTVHSNW